MRRFALLSLLLLTGCSHAAEDAPSTLPATDNVKATSPAATRPTDELLSEPSADTRIQNRLHTVGDLSRLAPISEVRIKCWLDEKWLAEKGAVLVTPKNLEQLLTTGKPIAPSNELIDAWHYSNWYRASFVSCGRRWSVQLYLGGLGIIADDAGHKGAFKFDVPQGDDS